MTNPGPMSLATVPPEGLPVGAGGKTGDVSGPARDWAARTCLERCARPPFGDVRCATADPA